MNNLISLLDHSKFNVFTEKYRSRERGGSHVRTLTFEFLMYWPFKINISNAIVSLAAISITDCKKNNEVRGIQFLRSGIPKISHGLSLFSSSSLYLSTQTSMPCATLAKSLFSTFLCRYSKISGGSVTVTYGLRLPFSFVITCNNLYESLYYSIFLQIFASEKLVGIPTHDKTQADSESYGRRSPSAGHIEEYYIGVQRKFSIRHPIAVIHLREFDGKSKKSSGILRQHIHVQCLAESSGSIVKEVI